MELKKYCLDLGNLFTVHIIFSKERSEIFYDVDSFLSDGKRKKARKEARRWIRYFLWSVKAYRFYKKKSTKEKKIMNNKKIVTKDDSYIVRYTCNIFIL